ncbi:MAG: GNAT family N-acetyltransferase [Gemmatimonadaceae bacterium]|nr:GNAT family N-acetyltransferase [Gemmatimonadaceae bacterium]
MTREDRPARARTPALRIEALDRHHDRTNFSSGSPVLDRYLRQHARQDVVKRVAATFLLVEGSARAILGFYTLAAASVQLFDLPPRTAKRLPKYPYVPATLLGRLAVDRRARGRRYGELLLLDALAKSLAASEAVASALVIVDAKDVAARSFYERYEFLPLPESPNRLFLPMQLVAALLRQ